MSYMEMLREIKSQTCHPPRLTKLTKIASEGQEGIFVSFVSSDPPHISRNAHVPPVRSLDDTMALIERGLFRLRRGPWAKVTDTAAWWITVGDALRLHNDGWTAKALALGWGVADLFGIGRQGSDQFAGLAAWLDGRRIAILDAGGANAGPWCRGFMGPPASRYRRPAELYGDAIMLWDWGQ